MYAQQYGNCFYHSGKFAVTSCASCGRPVCRSCFQTDNTGWPVCRPCCLLHKIKQRPSGGVMAVAVLNIIFGALGLTAPLNMFLFSAVARINPEMKFLLNIPEYRIDVIVGGMVGFGLSVLMLVSGIGILRLRESARKISLTYAVAQIAVVVIATLLDIFWLLPAMEAAGASVHMMTGAIIGMIAGIILGPVYPIVLLAFLTRPKVRVQFGHQLKRWTPPSAAVPQDRR